MSQAPTPVFDPNAPHQQRPRLRSVRGFPAQNGQQQFIGLTDARQISDKIVFVSPAFQGVLPLMDGQKSLDEIVSSVGKGLTRGVLETVVAQLDEAGLLFGPRFEAMATKMRADFDSQPNLPPASSGAMVEQLGTQAAGENASEEEKTLAGTKKLVEVMNQWIAESLKNAEKPSFDALPRAVVAPHIDYPRGWMNYAHVWGRMRVADRPARVVILGTNHFGESTGVTGCDKGYETPLGVCPADVQLIDRVRAKLGNAGDTLFANRYDHEREHSIELQIPWIQHCLGKDDRGEFVQVFGALVHDPSVNNGESYDGKGLGLDRFVGAMKDALAEMPGRSLIVSSADLSHVGPAFGDEEVMLGDDEPAQERRNKVFTHDRELLDLFAAGKLDEMIASMAWQQNPTRWCSLGNMVAAMRISGSSGAQILNYAAAMDERGIGMVSHAAAALS